MRTEISWVSSLLHKLHHGGEKTMYFQNLIRHHLIKFSSMSESLLLYTAPSPLNKSGQLLTLKNTWRTLKTLLMYRKSLSRVISEPSTNEVTLLNSRGYLLNIAWEVSENHFLWDEWFTITIYPMLDPYSDYEQDSCLGEGNALNQFTGINSCS